VKRITTTIKRCWLDQIVTLKKHVEYREIKPYWTKRLEGIPVPFELRLINGMSLKAPEAIVLINKVVRGQLYELHIQKILSVKNWKPTH
jgi:hypothetical protein